jgi:mitochondrial import inner membrane translocase subunit TIM50
MFSSVRFARGIYRGINQLNQRGRFSSEIPSESRAARKARMASANATAAASTATGTPHASNTPLIIGGVVTVGALLGFGYYFDDIHRNPRNYPAELSKAVKVLHENTIGRFNTVFEPASDSLLPDWPTAPCYAGVPLDTPCPPLLVIDLEKTLVASVHDGKHGWRHVKRPGVENFIKVMSQYYEVVLFSENDIGVVQEIFMAIDPNNQTHKLGVSAAEVSGTKVLKRLDLMNRDPRRIIVIDDNPTSVEKCMENTLLVKPFTDVNNKFDRTLDNLIPLLQAFIHDGSTDFRKTIADLGTNDANDALDEYRMRVHERKRQENRKRNVGLGGLIRGADADIDDGYTPRSAVMSASEIVGGNANDAALEKAMQKMNGKSDLSTNYFNKDKPKPSNNKKKGALFEWIDESEKARAEEDAVKRAKMNEVYNQRLAKAAQEKQQTVSEDE